jgi:hypothetical protein
MEGLYDPFLFSLPSNIDKENILRSIVKVRPLRTLEYSFFQTDEEADKFSETLLDENGLETIQYGFVEADRAKCSDPEFSQALFTHEFCELISQNTIFPTKTKLLGHGNGITISSNGYIATNFHLIPGTVEHLKKLDGYFEESNLLIKNIEVEYAYEITKDTIKYKKASEVFLAGTYSKKDAYGNRLDLAILKINEPTQNFIPLAKDSPKKFDQIYSIGFSMRTARKEDKRQLFGYEDASYNLRISSGLVIKIDGENSFLADTDGAPGNSGSAAINSSGELVGIYCGSTGNGIVDPSKSFRRYVNAQKLHGLLKNKVLT